MPERETVGLRVIPDRTQPQRPRVMDQYAQHAVPAGYIPQRPARRLIDPHSQELLELLMARIQDAQCRIPRPGQLPRGLQHTLEHQLEIQVADQAATQLQQPLQTALVQSHAPVSAASAHQVAEA